VTGGEVQVRDTGGVASSVVPGGELPGTAGPSFHVRVLVDDPAEVDEQHVHDVIAQCRPVHVPYTLEVVEDR
jgi:hypothetical protein